jgi:prepilin-type N-terminal cleavage/methylation domain-containing protein
MFLKGQKGFSLIEILVSMALLGLVGVAFLSALGTTSRTMITTDERETAKNFAEMQMEHIKSSSYDILYEPVDLSDIYPGYSVVTNENGMIQAQTIPDRTNGNIQKIELTVKHGNKTILTLDAYKAR